VISEGESNWGATHSTLFRFELSVKVDAPGCPLMWPLWHTILPSFSQSASIGLACTPHSCVKLCNIQSYRSAARPPPPPPPPPPAPSPVGKRFTS